ncbi:MAG TPA: 23S rRNA (adenine(2503)-C(2))-methyltransferase RlmN [Propionicimonas sp.]|jgi:23S rRNA (adenine2503-C2)-methyltransferase|nr:23S rRNA (adenine(2503)-C(2))-methyltransferase RlmN [Propionicimonas sp.]
MTELSPEEQAAFDAAAALAAEGRTLPLVMEAPRRGRPPTHWIDLTVAQRQAAIAELGLPKFRAGQLSRHLFTHLNDSPEQWTDIPKAERDVLATNLVQPLITSVRDQVADAGTTVKSLWRLGDGSLVESVLMRYGVPGVKASGRGRERATVCISSQAGCGMACPFCATGQGGLQRNLNAAEIVAQVIDAGRRLRDAQLPGGPGRINNIVFMGMGEPMANYASVLQAVRTIITPAPDGLGISARGVTVSTVGLVPAMRKLAEEHLPVTLAVSLHAPDDALRDELCPINTRWPIAEVIAAAKQYFLNTGRRVSIEYALIRDINDQGHRADELAAVLRGPNGYGWVHVNLIPLNPTPGSKWTASRKADAEQFRARLEVRGVPVTVRDTRGRDIDGACGQLAASEPR